MIWVQLKSNQALLDSAGLKTTVKERLPWCIQVCATTTPGLTLVITLLHPPGYHWVRISPLVTPIWWVESLSLNHLFFTCQDNVESPSVRTSSLPVVWKRTHLIRRTSAFCPCFKQYQWGSGTQIIQLHLGLTRPWNGSLTFHWMHTHELWWI